MKPNHLDFPLKLRKFGIPAVSFQQCIDVYGIDWVTNSMFCAGLEDGGRDWCYGDGGGPLINRNTEAVIGLMSWGYGCAEPGYPGVYTRVGKFVDWINKNKWTSA